MKGRSDLTVGYMGDGDLGLAVDARGLYGEGSKAPTSRSLRRSRRCARSTLKKPPRSEKKPVLMDLVEARIFMSRS